MLESEAKFVWSRRASFLNDCRSQDVNNLAVSFGFAVEWTSCRLRGCSARECLTEQFSGLNRGNIINFWDWRRNERPWIFILKFTLTRGSWTGKYFFFFSKKGTSRVVEFFCCVDFQGEVLKKWDREERRVLWSHLGPGPRLNMENFSDAHRVDSCWNVQEKIIKNSPKLNSTQTRLGHENFLKNSKNTKTRFKLFILCVDSRLRFLPFVLAGWFARKGREKSERKRKQRKTNARGRNTNILTDKKAENISHASTESSEREEKMKTVKKIWRHKIWFIIHIFHAFSSEKKGIFLCSSKKFHDEEVTKNFHQKNEKKRGEKGASMENKNLPPPPLIEPKNFFSPSSHHGLIFHLFCLFYDKFFVILARFIIQKTWEKNSQKNCSHREVSRRQEPTSSSSTLLNRNHTQEPDIPASQERSHESRLRRSSLYRCIWYLHKNISLAWSFFSFGEEKVTKKIESTFGSEKQKRASFSAFRVRALLPNINRAKKFQMIFWMFFHILIKQNR